MKVNFKNSLHNTECFVIAKKVAPMQYTITRAQAARVRSRLCGMTCSCASGDLCETSATDKNGEPMAVFDDGKGEITIEYVGEI